MPRRRRGQVAGGRVLGREDKVGGDAVVDVVVVVVIAVAVVMAMAAKVLLEVDIDTVTEGTPREDIAVVVVGVHIFAQGLIARLFE